MKGPLYLQTIGSNGVSGSWGCIFLVPRACHRQGFQWYANELRRDSDGDVACSFLEESPELAQHSGRDCHTQTAAAVPAGSSAQKAGEAESDVCKFSGQEGRRKLGSDLQAKQPLSEVPTETLHPLGKCPIVCCIDGNLAHALGPSEQVGFA